MAIYEGSNRNDTKTGDFTLMDGGLANDVLQDTHAGEIIMYGGPGFDFVAIDYIQNPDTFGTLYGGPGNDVVYGGAKKDTLYGGTTGDDYVVAHGHGSELYGRNGSDALVAGPGARDVLIVGGDGDDNASITITVRDQNRHPFTVQAGLYGSPGDDRIFGNDGDDLLIGGDGRDILHGGDGHDVMIGGLGPDDQLGGNGNDIFRFLAAQDSFHGSKHRDFISDFDPREHDRIDVSGNRRERACSPAIRRSNSSAPKSSTIVPESSVSVTMCCGATPTATAAPISRSSSTSGAAMI